MSDFNEIKSAFEESNKLTVSLRDAVESKADATNVANLEAKLAASLERVSALEAASARPGAVKSDAEADMVREVKEAFSAYLRAPSAETKSALEAKSTNTLTGPAGGFSVPQIIAAAILEAPVHVSPLRGLAEVVTVSTPNYTTLVEVTGAGYEWVKEGGTRSATNSPVFDTVVPTFGILAAKAPVTLEAMEDPQHNLAGFVLRSLAKNFAVAESIEFISGTGKGDGVTADKPSGLLKAGAIGTINTGVAATLGTNGDKFLDLTTEVHSSYHAGAVFLMNSKTKAAISKMKNNNGDYVVNNAVVAGEASTLWGYKIVIDENMPNVAAGATPILFGNFREGFMICDRVGMSFLEDPYTSLGYVNYIARKRVGSVVKDARALKGLRVAV